MPEFTAFFHSFAGLAIILIGFSNFFSGEVPSDPFGLGVRRLECYLDILIGTVIFSGSLIEYGYSAIFEVANYFPSYMTNKVTAASSVQTVIVFIIGAGVVELAEIGAA
ncbi:MAG: hypothetical protein EZS28_012792 [Streblomastix strix]|uniref:proton-translocating NAD(P)(+) transhydrogenase n=1 Tax=Streblomastix strix TaxID=222440 RepID=A0A5J4WA43_9EUKA|nr:MAG: hypothetical protein EZS28_012792 [Streblomastix strix]